MLRHLSGPQTALKAAPNSKGLVLSSHEGSRLFIGAGSISFFVVILTLFLGTHTVLALAAVDFEDVLQRWHVGRQSSIWIGRSNFIMSTEIEERDLKAYVKVVADWSCRRHHYS